MYSASHSSVHVHATCLHVHDCRSLHFNCIVSCMIPPSLSLSLSSPFFGSDRCSMVSLPTSAKVYIRNLYCHDCCSSHYIVCCCFSQSAEAMGHSRRSPLPPSQTQESVGGGGGSGFSNLSKKYGSLERAIHTERMDSPILVCVTLVCVTLVCYISWVYIKRVRV